MTRNSLGAVSLLLLGLASGHETMAYGGTILLGSDYLQTLPGTTFGGVPFTGSPIGPGNTDTIVKRLADASIPALGNSATIPVELSALQLVSVPPVDFGLGIGFYYMTLQSARGGPVSSGSMTITQLNADDHAPGTPEGTFTSFFDVFFDIRLGAPNGPIALSDNLVLTNSGSSWDADPAAVFVIVPGAIGNQAANSHTGKSSSQMDFFQGMTTQSFPTGAQISVSPASVPEPGPAFFLAGGLLALACIRWPKMKVDKP